jgi:hypothetical protein
VRASGCGLSSDRGSLSATVVTRLAIGDGWAAEGAADNSISIVIVCSGQTETRRTDTRERSRTSSGDDKKGETQKA